MLQKQEYEHISARVTPPIYRKLEKAAEIRGAQWISFWLRPLSKGIDMTVLQDWIAEIESDAADGASADDSVRKLHTNGISVINSIRVIKNSYQISLSEAKSLVANHHVWNSVTESVKPFHDDLIADINYVLIITDFGES